MTEELYSKFDSEILNSQSKIYDLTKEYCHRGSIEFLIMGENDFAEYVLYIGVEENEFSENLNYGGFTVEIPLKTYGFQKLQGLTFSKDELQGSHGSFYIINTYETFNLEKITFGKIQNGKLKAIIKYNLDYNEWKESSGSIEVDLAIDPIVISNQIVNPESDLKSKALSVLKNYLSEVEIDINSDISNLNGYRFKYRIE